MLDDHKFDVVNQLVQESKSLHRIKNEYLVNAQDAGREKCVDFWNRMVEDKEEHIEELTALAKEVMVE